MASSSAAAAARRRAANKANSTKPVYPPQGGERRLCLTIFVAFLLLVLSCVFIIYATVIIYVPSLRVLEAGFSSTPVVCTTQKVERDLSGLDTCDGWSSCEEWCLGVSKEACSHVWASVRSEGADVTLEGCKKAGLVREKCSVLADLEEESCKFYNDGDDEEEEEKSSKEATNKDSICQREEKTQLSCSAGVCSDIGKIYQCSYNSTLKDLEESNFCGCADCAPSSSPDSDYGEMNASADPASAFDWLCPDDVEMCSGLDPDEAPLADNATLRRRCRKARCQGCWQTCHRRKMCFDMSARRDAPVIGTDRWNRPEEKNYECEGGKCVEIHSLDCQRRCDGLELDVSDTNVVVMEGETVTAGECRAVVARAGLDLFEGTDIEAGRNEALVMTCTEVEVDEDEGAIRGKDCVNGIMVDFKESTTNYSMLQRRYQEAKKDGDPDDELALVPMESGLILSNMSKVRVNLEGCVNTLSEECQDFYERYGSRDGRNSTSKSVFPCFYDEHDPEFVLVDFDKTTTLALLTVMSVVPSAVLVVTCAYLCVCNKFVRVLSDGRMRLRCCGRYVSGIGGVTTNIAEEELTGASEVEK